MFVELNIEYNNINFSKPLRILIFYCFQLASHQFSKLGAEIRADLINSSSMVDLKSNIQSDDLLPIQHIISDQAMQTS